MLMLVNSLHLLLLKKSGKLCVHAGKWSYTVNMLTDMKFRCCRMS